MHMNSFNDSASKKQILYCMITSGFFPDFLCIFFWGKSRQSYAMHLLIECFNRCANIKFHFFFTQICLIYFYTSILSPSVYFSFFFFEKSSIFFIVYIRFSLVQFSFWIQQSWIICNRNEKRKKKPTKSHTDFTWSEWSSANE